MLTEAECEEAHDRYGVMVREVLLEGGCPAGDLDECAQEVFLRAWVNRSTYDPRKIGGWLRRTAANLAVDHVRRLRVQPDSCHYGALDNGYISGTDPRRWRSENRGERDVGRAWPAERVVLWDPDLETCYPWEHKPGKDRAL